MFFQNQAAIAQLGERQTEDLKVPGSIPGLGMLSCLVGQPVDDCTSLALFWMLQGTGLGCGAVARGKREGKPGMTHFAHLPPWWLLAPLGTRIGKIRARQRAQKHRKYVQNASIVVFQVL